MAMNHPVQPVLNPVRLRDLRPTQMTVGMAEVRDKQQHWREQKEAGQWLGQHLIPVVHGPGDTWWVIDHHHLARALYEEGVEEVLVSVEARLGKLSKKRFFSVMDYNNWLHPYDDNGKRHDWSDLPRHVGKLADDPFRSLAGAVRRGGGYAKTSTPYAEFLWADFFRDHIKRDKLEENFVAALAKALKLANSPKAAYLPGFAGPEG
ncbi:MULTISPECIES: ParB-like protein [unclassified Novosphingobium]|uniref:ParB-like protein n=1 Tax=unclassified Novosphingobium TaxID=2644732 RepID=UPI000A8D517D|nr:MULTISPECIES: ParB-like protein [unclassified Novosphingobium]MBN9144848.1 chromosome partitioning protein ParB [Novosphingobium sp.]MDR6708057.1 hypothetical protein [Novosphingobium sp. 1748]